MKTLDERCAKALEEMVTLSSRVNELMRELELALAEPPAANDSPNRSEDEPPQPP